MNLPSRVSPAMFECHSCLASFLGIFSQSAAAQQQELVHISFKGAVEG
jgi:hypothetical protein